MPRRARLCLSRPQGDFPQADPRPAQGILDGARGRALQIRPALPQRKRLLAAGHTGSFRTLSRRGRFSRFRSGKRANADRRQQECAADGAASNAHGAGAEAHAQATDREASSQPSLAEYRAALEPVRFLRARPEHSSRALSSARRLASDRTSPVPLPAAPRDRAVWRWTLSGRSSGYRAPCQGRSWHPC
jgi:hypothetical protein